MKINLEDYRALDLVRILASIANRQSNYGEIDLMPWLHKNAILAWHQIIEGGTRWQWALKVAYPY